MSHRADANRDTLIARAIHERGLEPGVEDAEWVRLLEALCAEPDHVPGARAKLVWDPEPRAFLVRGAAYHAGLDFYAHEMEAMISGSPRGFYEYRELEWVEFPREIEILRNPDHRKAGTELVEQELAQIRATIETVGQFELKESDDGLRLNGYRSTRS